MLSEHEIGEHISYLTAAVDRLSTDHADLDEYVAVAERFEILREQYRRQPGSLASCISRLSELRRRFDQLIRARMAEVVDRFHQINEQIRLAEREKACWRDQFIRISTQSGLRQVEGRLASVQVRSTLSRTLPQAGTPERQQLESLLRQSGCWEQVSQLSRPKLDRATKDNLLPNPQIAEVDRLCPVSRIYQVSSHPRNA
jgi:hypothetical protein